MVLPVALVPVALSAVRSLVILNRKVGRVRVTAELDDDIAVVLPPMPPNVLRTATDRAEMEAAFSSDTPERAALQARGLAGLFDSYMTDGAMPEERQRELFFRFLGLWYAITDETDGTGSAQIETDAGGIDRYLVKSAQLGRGTQGLQILRATAEVLVDFLGDNASVFLARSSNKAVLSAILREFAAESDLEQDSPERVLKLLLGSVAVAASEHGAEISDDPAAVMLFAALGRVRRERGDDFVAHIISHDGFTAVVSDWITRLASDPHLVDLLAEVRGLDVGSYDPSDPTSLPVGLQPIYGALSQTLQVVGENLRTGQSLRDEAAFRGVMGAVLTGVSESATPLLRDRLDGDRLMAKLLAVVIEKVGNHPQVQGNDLIAPVFGSVLQSLGEVIPELGQDEALSKAEILIDGLADRIGSGEFQAAMARLETTRGRAFARGLLVSLVEVASRRGDLLLAGKSEQAQAALVAVMAQMPDLLETGVDRDGALRLFEDVVRAILPEDPLERSFAAGILPTLLPLFGALGDEGKRLRGAAAETVLAALIAHFEMDRPVWQKLYEAELVEPLIAAIGTGLRTGKPPARLQAMVLAEVLDAAVGAFGRHGIDLAELAAARDDPQAWIAGLTERVVAAVTSKIFAKMGRGADASDVARLTLSTIDLVLTASRTAPLTDAQIEAFLTEQIDLLTSET